MAVEPTRPGRRALLLAALGLFAARASAHGPRIIAYVDIDTPGARAAFERFSSVLRKLVPRADDFDLQFVTLDQTDPRAVESLARRIADRAPWLLVATSLPTAKVAAGLGKPALFYAPADPVMLGLVASSSRPGGHMTGYAGHPPTVEKMIELAAEALPRHRRVTVLTDQLFARYSSPQREIVEAGKRLGREVTVAIVDTREQFEALAAGAFHHAQALVIPYTAVPFRHSRLVLQAVGETRIPAVYGSARLVREGGLLGIEADISDVSEVFARQAAAIASGTPPGEIPIVRPRRYSVSVNMAAVRELGLKLQPAFLKRVDQIVE